MSAAGRPSRLEWALLAFVLAVAAALRLSRLDLLEFKGDEAYATHIVLRALHGGGWPQIGLLSSVKVMNPPLFLYLLVPMFAISTSPVFVSGCIAVIGVLTVAMCWHIGRRYYGPVAGMVSAALFAVSPWAVICSRKIWAHDLVPLMTAGTLWALHALVRDGRKKAVFWVVLLPLMITQVHFAGLAVTATVILILAVLRPKLDWRWAASGVLVAGVLAVPYVRYQMAHDWTDFRKAAQTVGGQAYRIPEGMLVHPRLGYAMPRRDCWWQALGMLNSGCIEDILGLSARPELDTEKIWTPRSYFRDATEGARSAPLLGDAILAVQRIALLAALVWLTVRGWRRRSDWVLVLWIVGPVAVFAATRLWTVPSYFVVLYPAVFLVLGIAAQERWKWALPVGAVVVAANVWFVVELYGFLGRHGGAHGGYGTVIGYKLAAAQFLRERVDLEDLMSKQRYWQMDQWGKIERARLELPVLAAQMDGTGKAGVEAVLVVDMNRADFSRPTAEQVAALMNGRSVTAMNFGPMCLFLVSQ